MLAVRKTPASTDEKLWTRNELVEFLKMTPQGLSGLVRTGEFPAPLRLGRRLLRWRDCDVQQFLDSGGTPIETKEDERCE